MPQQDRPDQARRTAAATVPAAASAAAAGVAGGPDGQAAEQPRSVVYAATVQAVEAVGVLAASILAGVNTLAGHAYQTASGIALAVIGIGMAGLLGLIARGLRRGRRWSRTPAVLTQLFAGIVSIYLLESHRFDWGIPTIVLAIAGFATLLAPASLQVLTPGRVEKADKS